jgi:hypothetical protein
VLCKSSRVLNLHNKLLHLSGNGRWHFCQSGHFYIHKCEIKYLQKIELLVYYCPFKIIVKFNLFIVYRDYLRSLWVEEQKFLEAVYPVLKESDLEYPTDLFFIQTIPVIPPSMRPVRISGLTFGITQFYSNINAFLTRF